MKISKIALFCLAGIVLCIGVIREIQGTIELVNKRYEFEIARDAEAPAAPQKFQPGIDKTISHSVAGTGTARLPVEYEQNYTIYENRFYVTADKGQNWLLVPDDPSLGYARISDYHDAILPSNIYQSGEKISVAYGGRGPENISVITTDSQGAAWSVGSLSKTATHDLKKGYENLHIDFVDNGQTGYLAAIRNEGTPEQQTLVFRSVNTGVTWDSVPADDALYEEIRAYFELQANQHEQ